MVPAAVVDATLAKLVPLLDRDDAVIDGGNSYYHDDIRRAASSVRRAFTTSTSGRAGECGARSADTA
jgi:6-phosphogluconate dehydrogenase